MCIIVLSVSICGLPFKFRQAIGNLLAMELSPGLGGEYIFYAAYVNEGSEPFKEELESILRSNLVIRKTTLANE
jgi:hypothetical protein